MKIKIFAQCLILLLIVLLASELAVAREGDDYIVEKIQTGWNGMTDVKLKNPRTGNTKSISIVGTPDLHVGDRVQIKIENNREVIIRNGIAINSHQEDEFRVQTISDAGNGRYNVQLQSLRSPGYVHSTTVGDVYNIRVGDIVLFTLVKEIHHITMYHDLSG